MGRAGIGGVAHVGGEGLHLGDAQRLAQAVGERAGLESRVGVERAVAAGAGGGVVDEPRPEVEAVGERRGEGRTVLRAQDVVLLARADREGEPHRGDAGGAVGGLVPGLLQIDLRRGRPLLEVGKDAPHDAPRAVVGLEGGPGHVDHAGGEVAPCGLVVVHRQRELADVVLAGHPPARLARRLHRRQEQADEGTDDGDDDEQLDERERGRGTRGRLEAHEGWVCGEGWPEDGTP